MNADANAIRRYWATHCVTSDSLGTHHGVNAYNNPWLRVVCGSLNPPAQRRVRDRLRKARNALERWEDDYRICLTGGVEAMVARAEAKVNKWNAEVKKQEAAYLQAFGASAPETFPQSRDKRAEVALRRALDAQVNAARCSEKARTLAARLQEKFPRASDVTDAQYDAWEQFANATLLAQLFSLSASDQSRALADIARSYP